MTEKQQDTIYAAYLGLCTLQRCMVKWGQDSDVEKTRNLLKEMSDAFPFILTRVARSTLREPFVECEYPKCSCPRYGRCGNAR